MVHPFKTIRAEKTFANLSTPANRLFYHAQIQVRNSGFLKEWWMLGHCDGTQIWVNK